MKIISTADLDLLSDNARSSRRLRCNLNLHPSYDDPCQRLFNAIEPGTYIRPHRHTDPPKPETFVLVRGSLALLIFNDDGRVVETIHLEEGGAFVAVDVPPGHWHTALSLAPGTIFFETKPGPYLPLSDKDFAPWAPREQDPAFVGYLAELERFVHASEDARA